MLQKNLWYWREGAGTWRRMNKTENLAICWKVLKKPTKAVFCGKSSKSIQIDAKIKKKIGDSRDFIYRELNAFSGQAINIELQTPPICNLNRISFQDREKRRKERTN